MASALYCVKGGQELSEFVKYGSVSSVEAGKKKIPSASNNIIGKTSLKGNSIISLPGLFGEVRGG
jgi:hypothetical protein